MDSWGGTVSNISWDKTPANLEVMTTPHLYENRIRHSHSVFRYEDVDAKEAVQWQLIQYPTLDQYRSNHILTTVRFENQSQAERELREWLGYNAGRLQLNVLVLLWRNKPYGTALWQERYWQGGNKNELVICASIDDSDKVQWAHVFSWTKEERLKVDIRDYVRNQSKIDLLGLVHYLQKELPGRWVRREFAEFKYLAVELPWWAIIITYAVPLLVTAGVAIWVVGNEHRGCPYFG